MLKLVTVLAVVCAIAGAGALSSAAQSTSSQAVFRLISINTSGRSIDKEPKGPSVGDHSIQTSQLRNQVAQFGKPVGAIIGRDRATLTAVTLTAIKIEGVTTLPGGTLRVRGRLRVQSSVTAVAPVTGGTGRYAGAKGRSR
jgi:hypothetical protein